VEIVISDDGRGMDPDEICTVAVAKGVVERDRVPSLSRHDRLMLVCQPGFSTAARVTEISGRGVGMDVVKTTLQSLGGSLAIASEPGRGSRFILKLPLTVAIINVLLVRVGPLTVAVPLTAVSSTIEVKRDELAVLNGEDILYRGDEEIPLLSLHGLLGVPPTGEPADTASLFITDYRGRRVGMVVDRLLGHQEIFVKPLARPLAALPGVNGATILGDGQIIFIIDMLHVG
jgi:two-component system chemotaxis sensor kinase CheA